MKNLSDRTKLIISAALLAVFAAIAVGSVLLIANDTAGAVSKFIKLMLFLCGSVGCLLFLCMTISLAVKVAVDKAKVKAEDKRLTALGLKQNPEEDVIRKPVEDDDEEGVREFEEYVEKFLGNIVYPQGFIEFLKKYTDKGGEETLEKAEPEPVTRYVEKNGEYYEMAEIYTPDELIETNKEISCCAEYYMHFRDILFFADDESGHCHFLLDYGKGGEPTVKYLDDELDVVRTLADNFSEFAGKVKECTYAQFSQLLEEYEKNKSKR